MPRAAFKASTPRANRPKFGLQCSKDLLFKNEYPFVYGSKYFCLENCQVSGQYNVLNQPSINCVCMCLGDLARNFSFTQDSEERKTVGKQRHGHFPVPFIIAGRANVERTVSSQPRHSPQGRLHVHQVSGENPSACGKIKAIGRARGKLRAALALPCVRHPFLSVKLL